jgi:cyanobactin maturation PatA/PatG family protease
MDGRSILQGLARPDELLGDPEVCIAVLDGPVDLSHPCFAGADLTRLGTLVGDPVGQEPMSLHGTHVTSLLFGQPGSQLVGLAPRCRGLILPIFRDGPEGGIPQLDLARATERAVQEGAHVINVSGGKRVSDGSAGSMLERVLRLCDDNGVLVVAAVGDDGCDCLQVPAAVPSVLAVGATGIDGRPLELNNWGGAYRANGVLAPGQDIGGAAPGGGRQMLTGSSFATPVVSGVAALLVAAQLQQGREADPRTARSAILGTASSSPCTPSDAPECRRPLVGGLNARGAFDLIRGQGGTTVIDLYAAPVPSSPADRYAPQARANSSGPGVSTAGEPSSLGTPHRDPNKVFPESMSFSVTPRRALQCSTDWWTFLTANRPHRISVTFMSSGPHAPGPAQPAARPPGLSPTRDLSCLCDSSGATVKRMEHDHDAADWA